MIENIKEKSINKSIDDLSDSEKVYVAWALTEYLRQYAEPIEKKYEASESMIQESLELDEIKIEKLQKKLSWLKMKHKNSDEDTNVMLFVILFFSVVFLPGFLRELNFEQFCVFLAACGVSSVTISKLYDKVIKIQEKRERKIYSDLDELEKHKNLCNETLYESVKLKRHYHAVKNTINKLIYD